MLHRSAFVAAPFLYRKLTTRPFVITGVVLEEGGAPAPYARVRVSETSFETGADAGGNFAFNIVLTARAVPRTFTLIASKGARQATQHAPVSAVEIRVPPLILPPLQAPLAVRYARLKGRQIDWLLEPPRDFRVSAPVNGNEVVFRESPVYQTLVDLRNRFSVLVGHSELYFGTRGEPGQRYVEVPNGRELRMFVGSSGPGEGNHLDPYLRREATPGDIRSLTDPRLGWFAMNRDTYYENIGGAQLMFRRPLRSEDLAASPAPLAKFWSHLTRNGFPAGFGWVDMYAASYCAEEEPGYVEVTTVAPLMSLDVAMIHNDRGTTMSLGAFQFRETGDQSLRALAADDTLLRSAAERVVDLYGFQLQPNQVLIIPLRLVLTFPDPQDFEGGDEHTNVWMPEAAAFIRATPHIQFANVTLNGPYVAAALSARRPVRTEQPYVYGPSAALDVVMIDQRPHPVRRVPSHLLFASSGTPIGSCPFFSAFDGERWRPGGTILRGRDRAERIGTDERPLAAFTGRILIEELEDEVTMLDRLFVVAIDERGRETRLVPRDPRLREIDDEMVQLTRGQSIEVQFDEPPAAARRYRLGATGYYEPTARIPLAPLRLAD